MKFRRSILALVLGVLMSGTLIIGNYEVKADGNQNNSSSKVQYQESLMKQADRTGKKLKKLKLTGNWYSLLNVKGQLQGQAITIAKDGGVNWAPYKGVGNNTTAMKVNKYKSWQRLQLRYPDGSHMYAFVKSTTVKVKKVRYQAILFATSNQAKPTKKQKVRVAIKNKKALSKKQVTVKARF